MCKGKTIYSNCPVIEHQQIENEENLKNTAYSWSAVPVNGEWRLMAFSLFRLQHIKAFLCLLNTFIKYSGNSVKDMGCVCAHAPCEGFSFASCPFLFALSVFFFLFFSFCICLRGQEVIFQWLTFSKRFSNLSKRKKQNLLYRLQIAPIW